MTLCYESAEPTPVYVRPCEPWCDSTDDHASQHPDDRTCWGPRTAVDFTLEEPDKWDDGEWCYDRLEVIALRRPEHDVACVGLSHERKAFEVALRASEARELAAALLEVAEVIEQGAQ
ncbi:MAG TPA: hypothetical protein VNT31_01740 [Nocardioides sp.]|nr:hypothetical protein [Nocardioides sp.]